MIHTYLFALIVLNSVITFYLLYLVNKKDKEIKRLKQKLNN